jgi:hypothetical protein
MILNTLLKYFTSNSSAKSGIIGGINFRYTTVGQSIFLKNGCIFIYKTPNLYFGYNYNFDYIIIQ